jgi:hypothetical protein
MHASSRLRRAVSLVLLAAPLAAQTYPPLQWPLGAGPPRGLAAGQPTDGTLFKEVDQLGHQDDFWQNSLVGDADHDGRAEIVLRVVPVGGGTNSIIFYEDDGTGQYNQVYAFTLADGGLLAMGDIDKDGLTDLFLERALGFCDHQFVWMEASSPSGFPDHEAWTSKKEGNSVDFRGAIADVDGDGHLEFITADDNFSCLPTTLKIYETTHANSLALIYDQATGGDLGNPVIADFDQDGKQEIAVAEFSSQSILLFETTGNDAFALTSMTSQPMFNAYQLSVIGRLSPDGRPMLFLAGQQDSLDYRVRVYESLTPGTLSLVNQVQVPNNCGASIPQIWASDVVGTRVPEIMLDRLCDPVPIYQVGLNGALQLYDAPIIAESLEICAAPRSATHSGAIAVGTFQTAGNPQGSTLVLEQP